MAPGKRQTDDRRRTTGVVGKPRIVKMMIVVVAIFGVCWLPYHLYFLIVHHFPDIMDSAYVQHIYLAIYFLAMSNSMYNPIIYCWMNSRFREGFKAVFCCYALTGKQLGAFAKNNQKFTRYSCASEPYSTTRVTLNHLNTVNMDTLHHVQSDPECHVRRPQNKLSLLQRTHLPSSEANGHTEV